MEKSTKNWLIYLGGGLLTLFLLYFGFGLLWFDAYISDLGLFLLGLATSLGGIFTLTSHLPKRGTVGATLLFVGLYYFGRASHQIEGAWLGNLLGLISVLAAGLVFYIVFMQPKKIKQPPSGS